VVQVVAAAGLAVLLVGAGCDPPGQEQGDHGGSGQQGHLHAVDFLHVDIVLLQTLYVLVFVEHGTRRMHLGRVTAHPTGEWTDPR
jgi:putative transposase